MALILVQAGVAMVRMAAERRAANVHSWSSITRVILVTGALTLLFGAAAAVALALLTGVALVVVLNETFATTDSFANWLCPLIPTLLATLLVWLAIPTGSDIGLRWEDTKANPATFTDTSGLLELGETHRMISYVSVLLTGVVLAWSFVVALAALVPALEEGPNNRGWLVVLPLVLVLGAAAGRWSSGSLILRGALLDRRVRRLTRRRLRLEPLVATGWGMYIGFLEGVGLVVAASLITDQLGVGLFAAVSGALVITTREVWMERENWWAVVPALMAALALTLTLTLTLTYAAAPGWRAWVGMLLIVLAPVPVVAPTIRSTPRFVTVLCGGRSFLAEVAAERVDRLVSEAEAELRAVTKTLAGEYKVDGTPLKTVAHE